MVRLLENPFEFRRRILSAPLRRSGPYLVEQTKSDNPRVQLSAMAGLAYAAAPVILGNIYMPLELISSGFRGHKQFSHLSYAYTKLGYPMPMFNYLTPSSPAYKMGAKFGGVVGGGVMQTLGHLTPLVGWSPGVERGIVKLKLPPWVKKAGVKHGAKIGGRVGARLIPGVGWAMVAYDAYDLAVNRSLWGFDLD